MKASCQNHSYSSTKKSNSSRLQNHQETSTIEQFLKQVNRHIHMSAIKKLRYCIKHLHDTPSVKKAVTTKLLEAQSFLIFFLFHH